MGAPRRGFTLSSRALDRDVDEVDLLRYFIIVGLYGALVGSFLTWLVTHG